MGSGLHAAKISQPSGLLRPHGYNNNAIKVRGFIIINAIFIRHILSVVICNSAIITVTEFVPLAEKKQMNGQMKVLITISIKGL